MKELKERVTAVEGLIEENVEEIKKLQENIGMIDVYKEIIKNSEEARQNSQETYKFFKIIIIVLSILIIILCATIFYNQNEFTRYREESITKTELIDLLKSLE